MNPTAESQEVPCWGAETNSTQEVSQFQQSFKRNCTISTGIPNLGVWCEKWSNWISRVGQKNPTPTPTPPTNLRLLTTLAPTPHHWFEGFLLASRPVSQKSDFSLQSSHFYKYVFEEDRCLLFNFLFLCYTSRMGNLFTITGRMNCGISLAGHCPSSKRKWGEKATVHQWARETSLGLLSTCLLFLEFRFEAMLCFNLGSKHSDVGNIRCSRGPQVPHPCYT